MSTIFSLFMVLIIIASVLSFFKNNKKILQIIKWAFNLLNAFCTYMSIYFGSFTAIMT